MITNHTKNTILWADDDLDDFLLVREALQDENHPYEIVELTNGRKLLDHLYKLKDPIHFPRLIILDMNMPVLNGRETIAILKAEPQYRDIPVVVFTTSSSEMDKTFCRRFGVEMITKPANMTKLKEAVNGLLKFGSAV